MNLFRDLHLRLLTLLNELQQENSLPIPCDFSKVSVESPRDDTHGDISTNAAMVLSKLSSSTPKVLAENIKKKLSTLDFVTSVDIAGPGFINIRLSDDFWRSYLKKILENGSLYGTSTEGAGKTVNVEYVSVNPTGPMHAGHGRVAVVGDALATLLESVGFNVIREYYVNDAGGQLDTLARSVHIRYLEALGEKVPPIPEGLYPGDYLIPVGHALAEKYGPLYKNAPESEWLEIFRVFSVNAMMDLIRNDLSLLGIHHDVFTSENELVKDGVVERMIATLKKEHLVYTGTLEAPKGKTLEDWEPRPQLLFKSTLFGDDTDRPLQKSDGSWTYFAKDIACHYDKYSRTQGALYNVWGADHGGYVKRIKAAVEAISHGQNHLEVILCQMVNLMEDGIPLKMSKRSGTFITLQEVIEKVGKDVFRLIILMRKNDAPFDFDFSKVLEKSSENPVFYIQYAHARIQSVKRQALETFPHLDLSSEALSAASLTSLQESAEINLIKILSSWPRHVELAASSLEPHRLGFFLHNLAAHFHALWNLGKENTELRFIHPQSLQKTQDRLVLLTCVAQVLSNGLQLLGVKALDEMR
ncbi:MAG: arginine--tRNA ligase [Alphaproteobacteria bacterium 16-39-46]|nr:MAG: arginine--tRNA ligase [Alphaproteobacteria bacterium 16-39-46]OZA42218.1 MAG: arginine--tRNA ligase [Alphaproteobacteria bacterium 17-39-52]HQS84569.1 arginine--tRNA ligase [Alphaproteobacteria bacterium]HQS94358.1 arginine--tRNA ligase [Alphaproteobacteria bacterium]